MILISRRSVSFTASFYFLFLDYDFFTNPAFHLHSISQYGIIYTVASYTQISKQQHQRNVLSHSH